MNVQFATVTGSARLTVPCQQGQKVRVLTAQVTISAPAVGDQIVIAFQRSNAEFLKVTSPEADTAVVDFNCGIGLSPVVAASALAVALSAALPDCWWNFEIQLQASSVGAAVISSMAVTYETAALD